MAITEMAPQYVAPSLAFDAMGDRADVDDGTEIVEGIWAALGVVLAVFATVAAWCLAVCLGDVNHCHIHYNFPFDAEAHAECG